MDTNTEEVREASCSGNLPRMLRALDLPADPIDRHFLLLHVVETTYSQRHDDPAMRDLCRTIAERHINEFPGFADALRDREPSSPLPMVPTFQHLATVLTEQGDFDKAVETCERAMSFGIIDGTKSGFEGRIRRIRKQQDAYAQTGAKPQPRRRNRKPQPQEVKAHRSRVPRFKEYFPTTQEMNKNQRRFYDTWREAWERGDTVPVDGNISYLFCYVYRLFRRGSSTREPVGLVGGKISEAAIPHLTMQLTKLIEAYQDSELGFSAYCQRWLSDCHVLERNYEAALSMYPRPALSGRSSASTDSLLSLKLSVGQLIDGRDLLTLIGPQVTKWGGDHLQEIAGVLDRLVRDHEHQHGVNLLKNWARHANRYAYSVFQGSPFSAQSELVAYSFSAHEPAQKLTRTITREAEDAVRTELGKPPVRERKRA